MSTDAEWEEFVNTDVRGHAPYWYWRDRTIEEVSVVHTLSESLQRTGEDFFHAAKSRGTDDPPDCEALSYEGSRIGIEVTELVDGDSIRATNRNDPVPWEPFTPTELYKRVQDRIKRKGSSSNIKGGPYSRYILIIYSDEQRVLDHRLIEYLRTSEFESTDLLDRVFYLMSYCPWEHSCPYIELTLLPRRART
jgi:hypothetical protein